MDFECLQTWFKIPGFIIVSLVGVFTFLLIGVYTVSEDEYHAATKQFLDFQLRSFVDPKPVELRESVVSLKLAPSLLV